MQHRSIGSAKRFFDGRGPLLAESDTCVRRCSRLRLEGEPGTVLSGSITCQLSCKGNKSCA